MLMLKSIADELGDSETWYQMGMTVKEADELVKNKKSLRS